LEWQGEKGPRARGIVMLQPYAGWWSKTRCVITEWSNSWMCCSL
jgi:hypothetical protein